MFDRHPLLGVRIEGLGSGGRVHPLAGEGFGFRDLQPSLGVDLVGESLTVLTPVGAAVGG